MSEIPSSFKYTKDHEWLKADGDTATVGITDHAQSSLGDITFVELPEVGSTFQAGETFGVVESVKAASDLYMPINAEVLEINSPIEDTPELINQDPYKEAWLIKIKIKEPQQLEELLNASQYSEFALE